MGSQLPQPQQLRRPKRFIGRAPPTTSTSTSTSTSTLSISQLPTEILTDPLLNTYIKSVLPSNYNFEVHKTVWQVKKGGFKRVGLQMPEGLSMYATGLVEIVERFTEATAVILGDVTYGACCVDDYTARALGCDMLVHYGHSCLVPVDTTMIKTLYVFVEISVDRKHLVDSIRLNFPECIAAPSSSSSIPAANGASSPTLVGSVSPSGHDNTPPPPNANASGGGKGKGPAVEIGIDPNPSTSSSTDDDRSKANDNNGVNIKPTRLAVVGTVQFIAAVQSLKDDLETYPPSEDEDGDDDDDEENDDGGGHESVITTGAESEVVGGVVRRMRKEGKAKGKGRKKKFEVVIPQVKPLSPGEVLGCTAPKLKDIDAILYVGDGRFHLESIMIANPRVPAFRYDPYDKKLTREGYDHALMRKVRGDAVAEARRSLFGTGGIGTETREGGVDGSDWGVVLGTLGRQGSLSVLKTITNSLSSHPTNPNPTPSSSSSSSIIPIPILLSELSPSKLSLFSPHISTFVQTSCPRLSIDWGYAFDRPLLSPFEASVALGKTTGWDGDGLGLGSGTGTGLDGVRGGGGKVAGGEGVERDYPMDFYANDSRGAWTPRHGMGVRSKAREDGRPVPRSKRAAAAAAAGSSAGATTAAAAVQV